MARRSTHRTETSRAALLEAAEQCWRSSGAASLDRVARQARCAKGLIHYHFGSKDALQAALASRLGSRRRKAWSDAFDRAAPEEAIQRSWTLLQAEARDGTLRAWSALCAERGKLTGRAVNSEFSNFASTLGEAARAMLAELGLRPNIGPQELGLLLAGIVHGVGFALEVLGPSESLQEAYAAAWLGLLSLARPRAG